MESFIADTNTIVAPPPKPAEPPPRVETKNSRIMFRHQVLREIVEGPHRDQQQHLAKRLPQGPVHESTSTDANTIFHQLGVAIRGVVDAKTPGDALDAGPELAYVYDSIRERLASTEPITWCKGCGEEIGDCRCPVKKPRVG